MDILKSQMKKGDRYWRMIVDYHGGTGSLHIADRLGNPNLY